MIFEISNEPYVIFVFSTYHGKSFCPALYSKNVFKILSSFLAGAKQIAFYSIDLKGNGHIEVFS